MAEQLDILKGTGNFSPCDLIRLFALDIFVFKTDGPFIRSIDAVDAVKQCGFPGPIGTNDGKDHSLLDAKANITQGFQAAKGNRNILDTEKCHI